MSSQSGRLLSDPNLARARMASGAAFIGTTIEWYDFFAYATAAALVFGDLSFPNAGSNPMMGVLYAMATYAVGWAFSPGPWARSCSDTWETGWVAGRRWCSPWC